jgi:hypothetical protein
MLIDNTEFPVVVQAYQPNGTKELFVAEQVVHNQVEADNFTTRYAGFTIKARRLNESEKMVDRDVEKRSRRGSPVAIIIVLLLVVLVIVGFTTGWIQKTIDLNWVKR